MYLKAGRPDVEAIARDAERLRSTPIVAGGVGQEAAPARSGKCVWGKHDECDGTQSLTEARSSEPCGCRCHKEAAPAPTLEQVIALVNQYLTGAQRRGWTQAADVLSELAEKIQELDALARSAPPAVVEWRHTREDYERAAEHDADSHHVRALLLDAARHAPEGTGR
jgi:hypothetical protein